MSRRSRHRHRICHKPFIHIKITFIFCGVPSLMTFIEHSPYFGVAGIQVYGAMRHRCIELGLDGARKGPETPLQCP